MMRNIKVLKSEEGMATIETIPLLIIFVLFVSYGVGAFGIIHTGILHSIAARSYAFETFRHRTNLVYFRDTSTSAAKGEYYVGGTRVHGIQSETAGDSDKYILVTERSISKGPMELNVENREDGFHRNLASVAGSNQRVGRGVHPAWIKVQYGICLNSECGGSAN